MTPMELKPEKIEPISFRSGQPSKKVQSVTVVKWFAGFLVGVVLVLLVFFAWFVFTAHQIEINITPVPESLSVYGGILTPQFGSYYMMRPGEYKLKAFKKCFFPLQHQFTVSDEKRQNVYVKMQKLPGKLMIHTHQAGEIKSNIAGALVYIDGVEVGKTPLENFEIKPGTHKLEIHAVNYENLQKDINVQGCEKIQKINMAMLPGWSDVTVNSIPIGANVQINGKTYGNTPLSFQLTAGSYVLEISADRYKTWKYRLIVKPNEPREIKDVQLQPADGKLAVRTKPKGANIIIDGIFTGQTPLTTNLLPYKDHVVQISKPGYEKATRKVRVQAAVSKQLTVNLKPRKGIVHLLVEPANTELMINGKSQGITPKQLQLIAVEQLLEFKKKGYLPYRTRITPKPGFPQQLKIALHKKQLPKKTLPTVITIKTGYMLKLIHPGSYIMGSSRREQGRRSNETLRKIKLAKSFYIGIKEVTNKEFKKFMPKHNSGVFKSNQLNGPDQPVVRITWQEAALFCNWLSTKESLPPAYIKKGEKLIVVKPLNTGYRLPTEAEWEYCARFSGRETFLKYPWGNRFPPDKPSGNYSDQSAKDLLTAILQDYNDGYATTAPPAKFKPNGLGLYDLGGNVAEWCHDYYSIYSYSPEKTYLDPPGPEDGKLHVIRGSSWKDGSISTLRLAYRRYGNDRQEDVGFRVCRYLK